ncbi:uncharacterized protein [Branchiostoma lanceolatum]|uniref:uncharacterized protein isoform X2 n=1 Tax=Branchiostoma lanceolatum TaxID=7740 RepID=UPI003456C8FB
MLIIVFSYSNRAIIASGPVRQWPGPWEVHYIINPCGGCYRGLATAKNEVFSHRCSVRKRKMGKLKKTKSKAKKDTLATQDEVAEIFREIKSRQYTNEELCGTVTSSCISVKGRRAHATQYFQDGTAVLLQKIY